MNSLSIKQGILYSVGASLLIGPGFVFALDWTVQPSIDVEQTFSDNVNLTAQNRQKASITQVNPGISVRANSTINTFDLNYRMQNLFNNTATESDADINNQLQMDSSYQFVADKLYIETSSSISQQNTSNRRIASDNISSNDNSSATVYTLQTSPYWKAHFNSFADAEFRATYDFVGTKSSESLLSKTHSVSENISLTSGSDFKRISWSASVNNSHRFNSESETIRFQDSQGELRYAIGQEFNVFAQVGHSSNSFNSNSDSNKNGVSYTFGGQWKPSQRFSLEAGYGNNYFVTVDLMPFNRLHWITTYTNNDIGLNRGGTWNTDLNYTTRRTTWTLSYTEDTLTTQQLLLEQDIFNVTDAFGDVETNILLEQSQQNNIRLPSLTDEVFISKTIEIQGAFRSGKSELSANMYHTFRLFEVSGNKEALMGLSGSWNWKFYDRMNSIVQSGWQKTESKGANAFVDNRVDASVAITRNISSRLTGKIEYRFIKQVSSDILNNYDENRISANLTLKF